VIACDHAQVPARGLDELSVVLPARQHLDSSRPGRADQVLHVD